MTLKFYLLILGVVLLITTAHVVAEGKLVGEMANDVQTLPCEKDPFCQRESWNDEFERICIQTGVATTLEAGQLEKLIRDSDELLPHVQALPPAQARLYTFRLKNCRSFFVYALELQKSKLKTPPD